MLVVSKAAGFDQQPSLPSSLFFAIAPWTGQLASLACWDYVLIEAVTKGLRVSAAERVTYWDDEIFWNLDSGDD